MTTKSRPGRRPRSTKPTKHKVETRLTADEFKEWQRLASRHTAGNLSEMIRRAVTNYQEQQS